jgi:hypothetical protein
VIAHNGIKIIALLFALVSLVAAESQENLYYRALKAEEAENIPEAMALFRAAVAEQGPYTAEIQEIIDSYEKVLGETGNDSLETRDKDSWEFHTYGNVAFLGLNYKRNDVSEGETGTELSSTANVSVDYNSAEWNHSFEVSASGDWFINKDDMPSLDTSAWEATFGLGYSLIGNALILDIGADMNISEEDDWTPDFYLWVEKYFARMDKHKFGVAVMNYYNLDGSLFTMAYLSWHRYAKYGWKSSVYVGGRFEADSISRPYWLKLLGPSLKPSFSYRFKTDISIDTRMNLFYGFVVDGPDSEYEKVQKFSGSWALTISWNPGVVGLFLGAEQFYRYYVIPSGYTIDYPRSSLYTELKAGIKWNI